GRSCLIARGGASHRAYCILRCTAVPGEAGAGPPLATWPRELMNERRRSMAEYERTREEQVGRVRATDIEPYTALRWVGTLFKAAAVFLFVAVIGQFVADLRYHGAVQLPAILGELARTLVLAVVLWGG